MLLEIVVSIYHSIHPQTTYPCQDHGTEGHTSRVHPGQDTSQSQGMYTFVHYEQQRTLVSLWTRRGNLHDKLYTYIVMMVFNNPTLEA